MIRSTLALCCLLTALPAPARQAVWLGFDSFKAPDNTVLSGTLRLSAGKVEQVESWLFEPQDEVTADGFKCALQRYDTDFTAVQKRKVRPEDRVTPKGLLVTVDAPDSAVLKVETNRGTAELPLASLNAGKTIAGLDGVLLATATAPVTRVSTDQTNNDMPSVAVSPDGKVAVAWVAYDDTADRIVLWREGSDSLLTISAEPGDYHQPALGYLGAQLMIVWPGQREKGNWELYGRVVNGDKLGPELRLTNAAGTDFAPRIAATPEGRLWLTWQGWRAASFDILAAELTADGLRNERAVTSDPSNDWQPAIAAGTDGQVWVAYDSYRHGSYDVYLRRIAPGEPGPEILVAGEVTYEANAAVAVAGDGIVWVAWDDGGEKWAAERGRVLHGTRSLRLRGLQGVTLVEPAVQPQSALPGRFADMAELPNLTTGPKGELQLVYRRVTVLNNQPPNGPKIRQSRGIWNAYCTASTRDGWSDAAPLADSCGRNDMRLELAPGAGANVVTFAADDRVRQRSEVFGTHEVQWAKLPSPIDAAPPAAKPLQQVPKDEALPRDPGRNPDPVWTVAGSRYELVYGDTHRHTDLSRCGMCNDGSLLDTYRYALDVAKLDFLAISDHDQDILRHRYDRDSRPFDTYAWWRSQKIADLMHHPPYFCALYGYEHGGSYQARGGHKNVIYEVRGRPCLEVDAPEALFKALGGYNAIAIPHQLADGASKCDWTKWDGEYETVAEIFQARGNYERSAAPRLARDSTQGFYYQDAIDNGARIGVIASSDHGLVSNAYAGVYATARTRAAIIEGLRQKRTYGATERIRMEFACGADPAGSAVQAAEPRFACRVAAPSPIEKVELVRDGQFVYAQPGEGGQSLEFTWADNQAPGGYYYLRTALVDGELGWTSPIWIGK